MFLELLLCIILRTTYASLNTQSIMLVSALGLFFVCRLLTYRGMDIFRGASVKFYYLGTAVMYAHTVYMIFC